MQLGAIVYTNSILDWNTFHQA